LGVSLSTGTGLGRLTPMARCWARPRGGVTVIDSERSDWCWWTRLTRGRASDGS
jgi:hypothetical protein